MARGGLEKALETLKANFDYVILDTAPVGMVTDTLLIGRVADLSVYVCRADYTHKAEFTLINELAENNKLPNLCIAVNGLDLNSRKVWLLLWLRQIWQVLWLWKTLRLWLRIWREAWR